MEFAVLLPLLLLIVGVVLDVSRLYAAWINLEAATNDAAQAIATSGGTTPSATAVQILSAEVGQTFTAAATLGTCASPTLTTGYSFSTSPNTSGGTTSNPAGQATVTSCIPFRTLFPYPIFTINGYWTLSSQKQFTTLVGR